MAKDSAHVYRNVTLATRQRPFNIVDNDSEWILLLTCGHEHEFTQRGGVAFGLPTYLPCEECTDVAEVAVGLTNP